MTTFFPVYLLSILAGYNQCFSKPNYVYFKSYIWAVMMTEGSKRMTNLAESCFFLKKDISSLARFLSSNKWDIKKVKKKTTEIVIREFSQQLKNEGAFLAGMDTTLVAKASKKMLSVQKWHPSSGTAEKMNGVFGHHWSLIGLIIKHPIRYVCFPIAAQLIPGKKNNQQFIAGADGVRRGNFWDTCIALVRELKTYLPNKAPLRLVADAYFSKAPFIKLLLEEKVHLVSRLRKDAKGWDRFVEPVIATKGRGRPRKKGTEWRLADLLKIFTPDSISVSLYGKKQTLNVVVRDVYLRGLSTLVRVVVIQTATKPILLVSTDLTLSAKQIIEIYGARFSIEISIRDLKQHFGFTDYQCYTYLAFFRFVTLSCVAFCLWMIVLIKNDPQLFSDQPSYQSFSKQSPLSFPRLRGGLKKFVIKQIICSKFPNYQNLQNIDSDLQPLFRVA
jgi:hypothetical protein